MKRFFKKIKRLIVFVLVALIVISVAYMDMNTRYTTQKVNMREKADISSMILLTLSQDTKVVIVGSKGDWIKIFCNGRIGYIYCSYLKEKKTSSESESAQSGLAEQRDEQITQWRQEAVSYCQDHIGDTYSQQYRDDNGYCDCSSLVRHAFQSITGEDIGSYTVAQVDNMKDYEYSIGNIYDVAVGDIVYYMPGNNKNHCGLYIGDGQVINASSSAGEVKITTFTKDSQYWYYGCNAAAYCYDRIYQ